MLHTCDMHAIWCEIKCDHVWIIPLRYIHLPVVSDRRDSSERSLGPVQGPVQSMSLGEKRLPNLTQTCFATQQIYVHIYILYPEMAIEREREIWYIYILYSIHIIDTLWYSAFFPRHPIKEYKCKTCRAIAVGPRLEGNKYFEDPNSRPIVPSGK